ncbi:MAG: STAS domain-containing protein [Halothiobacillaceae bacterium]|nr:STAS domain-containing protein [Halothiobacillaceae bacterium]
MHITDETLTDAQVVHVSGRLDSTTSPLLEQYLLSVVESHPRVIVDFTRLDYISSAGLRVLLMAAKKSRARSGAFALCALKPALREVFEISGFLSIIAVHPDAESARQAFSS